jgi:predicted transcriptional regulator
LNKLPCERALWKIIPVIRKEIACCMVNDFGLNQREAAKKLNVTPSAISQYKCNKRADKKIKDITILNEIRYSSNLIINNGNDVLNTEICRLCKLINKNNPF